MNETAGIRFHEADDHPRSPSAQRLAMVGGGALAVYGLSRRSLPGLALAASGGALALLVARSGVVNREPIARASIQLNCPVEQAYRFWRDFENLPRFMRHLEEVSVLDNRHSRWIALGPMGTRITWDAEIFEERENELISWQSLPGSQVRVHGIVRFRPATGGRGTIVSVIVRYLPPAGRAGAAVAKMLGKDPSFIMRQDLRRLKALIETGEIPTTEGQPHGPRDVLTGVVRTLDPDRPIRREREFSMTEVVDTMRRIS